MHQHTHGIQTNELTTFSPLPRFPLQPTPPHTLGKKLRPSLFCFRICSVLFPLFPLLFLFLLIYHCQCKRHARGESPEGSAGGCIISPRHPDKRCTSKRTTFNNDWEKWNLCSDRMLKWECRKGMKGWHKPFHLTFAHTHMHAHTHTTPHTGMGEMRPLRP